MKKITPAYPTSEHQKAAEAITKHFVKNYNIGAVLLVNSCARGATRDSCLDCMLRRDQRGCGLAARSRGLKKCSTLR